MSQPPPPPPYGAYPGGYPPPPQPYSGFAPPPTGPRNGLGIAALVIAIVGLVFCWTVAGGVILGLTAVISEENAAWFVMPVAVALLLTLSIWREARKRHQP